MLIKHGLLLALIIVSSGCATVISGTRQEIKINSKPEGATVTIVETCDKKVSMTVTTPAVVNLPRSYSYHVIFDKDGYYPTRRGIGRKANNAIIADLILLPAHWVGSALGLIFAGGDHLTGAIFTLYPEEINIELKEMPAKDEK